MTTSGYLHVGWKMRELFIRMSAQNGCCALALILVSSAKFSFISQALQAVQHSPKQDASSFAHDIDHGSVQLHFFLLIAVP
jgi:hypothetical protein